MIHTSLAVPSSSCRISGSLESSSSSGASHVFTCKKMSSTHRSRALSLLRFTLWAQTALLLPWVWNRPCRCFPSEHKIAYQVEDCQVLEIILVLDSQNLYPDLSFYLVLRAGSLCKPSLEMWVSNPKVHKNHLMNY